MTSIPVRCPGGEYEVIVESGSLGGLGARVAAVCDARRVLLVIDRSVVDTHGAVAHDALATAGMDVHACTIEADEHQKTIETVASIYQSALAAGLDRHDVIVAVGGGLTGDVAGFAAASYLRGIDFVAVPTTLLAMVDASVGGKTGINSSHGKNLIGSFHQPRLVLADTGALDTLPARELAAGYGEMIKYGLIDDTEFFTWLEANGQAILDGDAAARRHAIAECCRAKARIVAEDERESGHRALLNLGHTFAHAFEAESGYGGALLHGEAVSIGIILAFRLSARMGLCDAADAARVTSHLAALGVVTHAGQLLPSARQRDALIEHMSRDKKMKDGRLHLILVRGIGQAFVTADVSADDIRAALDEFLSIDGAEKKPPR